MEIKKEKTMNTVRFATVGQAENEFQEAWNNPAYTQIEFVNGDLNAIFKSHYDTSDSVVFTRELLWEAEVKKAWDPKTYIPNVVKDGKSWGRMVLENGDGIFKRTYEQRQFANNQEYGTVLEEVYMNWRRKLITCLGIRELVDNEGQKLESSISQSLFHAQHSVQEEENCLMHVWRMVLLTKEIDQNFPRTSNMNSSMLPKFVEVYITNDLKKRVTYKG